MSRGEYPATRMRRNRMKDFSRRLVAENKVSVDDLIWPLFVIEGQQTSEAVASMPGVNRYSIDVLIEQAGLAVDLGIPAIAIFPSIDADLKTADGGLATDPENLVCRAVRAVKAAHPDLGIICDVALDPFTNHGHDGLLENGDILNFRLDRLLILIELCLIDSSVRTSFGLLRAFPIELLVGPRSTLADELSWLSS